jgi:hypothetical protein
MQFQQRYRPTQEFFPVAGLRGSLDATYTGKRRAPGLSGRLGFQCLVGSLHYVDNHYPKTI